MTTDLLTDLTIFALAVLVGFEVISKVPATLHTPLMSGANSIHGVVAGRRDGDRRDRSSTVRLRARRLVAMAFAAMNVVGGYVVTDRMLHMFRRPPPQRRRRTVPARPTAR